MATITIVFLTYTLTTAALDLMEIGVQVYGLKKERSDM